MMDFGFVHSDLLLFLLNVRLIGMGLLVLPHWNKNSWIALFVLVDVEVVLLLVALVALVY